MVSFGLIATSVVLNYRMGFSSAGNAVDGVVYGTAAGLGDGLKALCPFAMFWGRRHKDTAAIIAGGLVFVVITAYSFTAAVGFAAQHRAQQTGAQRSELEVDEGRRRDLARAETQRDRLGVQRSSREVKARIDAILQNPAGDERRTVAEISQACTVNRPSTRSACASVASLQEELARAEDVERLDVTIAALRDRQRPVAGIDPQMEALQGVADALGMGDRRAAIRFGLALLVALLVELGSGLGLYVVTTPWRGALKELGPPSARAKRKEAEKRPIGDVGTFVMERLEPHADAELRISDIYNDYSTWARWREETPHRADDFVRELEDLAAHVGIGHVKRNGVLVLQNVRFA